MQLAAAPTEWSQGRPQAKNASGNGANWAVGTTRMFVSALVILAIGIVLPATAAADPVSLTIPADLDDIRYAQKQLFVRIAADCYPNSASEDAVDLSTHQYMQLLDLYITAQGPGPVPACFYSSSAVSILGDKYNVHGQLLVMMLSAKEDDFHDWLTPQLTDLKFTSTSQSSRNCYHMLFGVHHSYGLASPGVMRLNMRRAVSDLGFSEVFRIGELEALPLFIFLALGSDSAERLRCLEVDLRTDYNTAALRLYGGFLFN